MYPDPFSSIEHFHRHGVECFASVDQFGNARINGNHSPIESVLLVDSWAVGQLAYKNKPFLKEYGPPGEDVDILACRYHLSNIDSHRPLEIEYWVMMAAMELPYQLKLTTSHIEDLCWFWLNNGDLTVETLRSDLPRLLDERCALYKKKLRSTSALIQRIHDDTLSKPETFEVLKSTHESITREANAIDNLLTSGFTLLLEKTPSKISDLMQLIRSLNEVRRALGMDPQELPFKIQKTSRRLVKSARSVIVKSVSTLRSLTGNDQSIELLDKRPVWFSHPDSDIKFKIQISDRVLPRSGLTHDGYLLRNQDSLYDWPKIEVFLKSDKRLANICVGLKQTPMYDQVSGLKLMIESGNEIDLFKTGNWYDIEDEEQFARIIGQMVENPKILVQYPYLNLRSDPIAKGYLEHSFTYNSSRDGPLRGQVQSIAQKWFISALDQCPSYARTVHICSSIFNMKPKYAIVQTPSNRAAIKALDYLEETHKNATT